MKMYKTYLFRNQDPVIGELKRILIDRYGITYKKELSAIDKAGGPSRSCLDSWFNGKVKRPQNATIEAAGRAVGMKRVWVKNNGNGKKEGNSS